MIKFGTSGWRAIISDEFTFDNVKLVTQAIANMLKKSPQPTAHSPQLSVVVGYDTRFLSKEFAQACADVLASNNIEVLLCDRDTPTPVIAYQILKNKAAGGINFTASHNPPEYNGIKFSPETAAPAPPEVTKQIEEEICRLQSSQPSAKRSEASPKGTAQSPQQKYIKTFDPKPEYFKQIKKLINFTAIRKAKLKIAIDCLYGTSRAYLDTLLKDANCKVEVLHDWLNPSFDGKRPEPAEENIQALIECVKKRKMHIGLSCDGDADRFGIVDSDGTVISANQVISLLLYHLIKTRPLKKHPTAARTVATTHMVDKICEKFGVKVHETPVGFKYFAEYLIGENCVIAGEESGGLSISGHVPEKDGILACLLMAEMVAINKKPAGKLLEALYKEFGYFYFERLDLAMSEDKKKKLMDGLMNNTPQTFANQKIASVNKSDGCKLQFEDESWALFRASGTEPIVRCYFEARTSKRLKELIAAGKGLT
ncbi:MAG: phosphoglucomutase/phosphomannomutase family protein [Candidatus Omnitrophota bacterium]